MTSDGTQERGADKPRMLNSILPAMTDDYTEVDGGLLVKNVILLAKGQWADSKVQTPLYYPEVALERDAGNWPASTYWARHMGGAPRNIVTDRLGDVRNPHYDPKVQGGAIVGEVFYDCLTQTSRDGAALALAKAKAGTPLAVSVEHGGTEAWDPIEKRFMATSLVFYGAASVDKGACSVCGLPKKANESQQQKVREMEQAEFDKALADLKAGILGEVDAKFAALKIPADPAAKMAELSATNAGLVRELGEAKKKIEALEKQPNFRTMPENERALEAPADHVRWDQRTGRVGH